MTTFFVSDVHLDPRFEATNAAFSNWLESRARDASNIYILGDLFEAWIGDDDDDNFKLDKLSEISRVAANGVEIAFMHGNRDFLAGDRFAEMAGASMLPDPAFIDVSGERWLLSHGDAWCTDDEDYQAFRKQVRDPLWQQAVLARPLAERRALAAKMRDASADAGANKSASIMDVNQESVEASLKDNRVTTIIHGHTHRPACHRFTVDGESATRWVLGDWYQRGSYLEVSDSCARLHSFAFD